MNDEILLAALDAGDRRREERRRFIKFAGGAAIAAGSLSALAACSGDNDSPGPAPSPSPTPAPSPSPSPSPTPSAGVTDADILNFALNLEYLEAEYYTYAVTGAGIQAQGIAVTGSGTPGSVIIKPNPTVPFASVPIQQYAWRSPRTNDCMSRRCARPSPTWA